MTPKLAACLAGISAAAGVLTVVELASARVVDSRLRSALSVRRVTGVASVVLAVAAAGPVGGLVLAGCGWLSVAMAPRLQGRSLRREVELGFPEFAAALSAALAAGLKPVDALSLVGAHRVDALGLAVRSVCARINAGESLATGLAGLQTACPSGRITALVVVLESGVSRGTDIAEAVSSLAASARSAQLATRRERAAKAGPLIQLVVALGLVPSVLLLIAAVAVGRGFGAS